MFMFMIMSMFKVTSHFQSRSVNHGSPFKKKYFLLSAAVVVSREKEKLALQELNDR